MGYSDTFGLLGVVLLVAAAMITLLRKGQRAAARRIEVWQSSEEARPGSALALLPLPASPAAFALPLARRGATVPRRHNGPPAGHYAGRPKPGTPIRGADKPEDSDA